MTVPMSRWFVGSSSSSKSGEEKSAAASDTLSLIGFFLSTNIPHAPASAQQMRGLVDHLVGKAESLEDFPRGHVGVDQIAVADLLIHGLQALQLALRGA